MRDVSQRRRPAAWALAWVAGVNAGCTVVKAGNDETRIDPLLPSNLPTTAAADAAAPVDTPIVFVSDRNGDSSLFRMDVDGGNVTALTSGESLRMPRWSPDGSTLAVRREDAMDLTSGLALLAPDGTQLTSLTSGGATQLGGLSVNWAPDGQQLAFAIRIDPFYRLHTLSRAGGTPSPLFPDLPGSQPEAAWSPVDPSQLAYVASPPVSRDIWLKDVSTDAEPINLTNDRVAYPFHIRWSPDGQQIAFDGFARTGEGALGESIGHGDAGAQAVPDLELFILDVASGELRRLTETLANESQSAWSPDGTQLVYTRNEGEDADIWVLPVADPSQARDLIGDDDDPHWEEGADWRWSSD